MAITKVQAPNFDISISTLTVNKEIIIKPLIGVEI